MCGCSLAESVERPDGYLDCLGEMQEWRGVGELESGGVVEGVGFDFCFGVIKGPGFVVDLSPVQTMLPVGCIEAVALGEPADEVSFLGEASRAVAGAEFGWWLVAVSSG